jgi:hypothetical protein
MRPQLLRHDARRRRLLLGAGCLWLGASAGLGAQQAEELARFLELSQLLTEDAALDAAQAARHLAALAAEAETLAQLQRLWQLAGLGTATAARSLAELEQRGLDRDAVLQALADRVMLQWFTGIHVAADGSQRVIDYPGALAWCSLGYRPGPPGTCGGRFGHWAAVPQQA